MKAHLLHRDRDFDPAADVPPQAADLIQDLGLDSLVAAMAGEDEYLYDVAIRGMLFSLTDPEDVIYRQHALRDCIGNEAVVRELYDLAVEGIVAEKKIYRGLLSRYPESILHREVEALAMFFGVLKRLRRIADDHAAEFRSEAFSDFFTMLQEELSDEYFDLIDEHLHVLRFRNGTLMSARFGKGFKGRDYLLRRPLDDRPGWLQRLTGHGGRPSYTFQIPPRDEAGARALSELQGRGLNLVANAMAQSTDHILAFVQAIRAEVGFYVCCLQLRQHLADKGEPTCFPEPRPAGEIALTADGLYDVALSLNMEGRAVGNHARGDGRPLVVITGANTGGKSTFLRGVGLAQLMMQAGMFVGAEEFRASVAHGIFSHYKREEDPTMTMGKLDEELNRMSETADRLGAGSLLLSNESFSSTNEAEGSEIGRQVFRALLERGVRVYAVTHLYELAESLYEQHGDDGLFLRAERRPDGVRTFKLIEGEPLPTSYGQDLYTRVFGAEPART